MSQVPKMPERTPRPSPIVTRVLEWHSLNEVQMVA